MSLHSNPSTIFAISGRGGKSSLIVLPDLGGSTLYCQKIASHIEGSINLYGMRLDKRLTLDLAHLSLSGVAKRYAADLMASDLPRPFHLVGHSFAGFLAYETAIHLALSKAEVGMVLLLNSELPPHLYAQSTIRWRRGFFDQARKIRQKIGEWRDRMFTSRSELDLHQALHEPGFVRIDLSKHPEAYHQIIRHQYRAMVDYEPSRSKREVTLLRATDKKWMAEAPADMGWGRFSKVSIFPIPGGHLDMVRNDQTAAQVAQILQVCISSHQP